jgi:hypothetical protein
MFGAELPTEVVTGKMIPIDVIAINRALASISPFRVPPPVYFNK